MTPEANNDSHESELSSEKNHTGKADQQIIRKGKLVLYNSPEETFIDESVISVQRYNCFGAHLFPGRNSDLQLMAGVTSPHPRDGKTTAAANLATFLAVDTQDDTVLVDLSFRRPSVHTLFGIAPAPGIMDSLKSDTITVTRSAIKGLWILPFGTMSFSQITFDRIIELRETLVTLKRQFRFVILDLPSVLNSDFPNMLSGSLDGYFVVAQVGKTKKTEIKQVLDVLNESKVIGFIMNRISVGLVR
jgi:Mrp family chromosome partitioning ATPase